MFLAAMSSSRSDDVTKCVRLPVCKSFCLVWNILNIKQDVLRELLVCLRGVFLKFQGCFRQVSRRFQESLKGANRKF